MSDSSADSSIVAEPQVVVRGKGNDFLQNVVAGKHQLRADEPVEVGGKDLAPNPYDYLLAALGTCTSMTIGWYARKKNIPVEDIRVSLWQSRIHAKDCEDCLTKDGMIHRIELEIAVTGNITAQQHKLLMEAAEKCPVHKTLSSEIDIKTRVAASASPSGS
jgi:putative redox protein